METETRYRTVIVGPVVFLATMFFWETVAAQTPINQSWESYQFDGKIGEERVLKPMKVYTKKVGGDDSDRDVFVYEPPSGWIILRFQLHEVSRFGEAEYTPRLTAKDSKYLSEGRINEQIKNVQDYVLQYEKDERKQKYESYLNEFNSYFRDWYRKFESKNNHLEVECSVKSRTVRDPVFKTVLDTKTAQLDLDVTITLGRVLTEKEAEIAAYKLKRLIDEGKDLSVLIAKGNSSDLASSSPTVNNFVKFEHPKGRFVKNGKVWTEYHDDVTYTFTFKEAKRDDTWLYLRDDSRGMNLKLPSKGGIMYWQTTGAWNAIYTVQPVVE